MRKTSELLQNYIQSKLESTPRGEDVILSAFNEQAMNILDGIKGNIRQYLGTM